MNLNRNNNKGFTLGELMMAVAIGSVILAATLIASVALQKSFNAVDNYFAAHVQQIRIVDYLSRDVKRSYIVTSTSSPQTVTCTIPDYIIKSGDPDAGLGVGVRRSPTITKNANGTVNSVNYGTTTTTVVYSISNQSILRTENGALTTIAASTDNLLPTSVLSNISLTNTEYLTTSITFLPIFTSGGATAERSGTTIYSTAYLRNKRRG
jgi:prepilin-type N-terminal cleavage/methylation domain-containing protein